MHDSPVDTEGLAALLAAAEQGEQADTAQLFASLYTELHRRARRQLQAEGGAATLSPAALLDTTYADLSRRGLVFPDRRRFFAYAARAMRAVVVDYVRARRALKRDGAFHLAAKDTVGAENAPAVQELEQLAQALDRLAVAEPELVELVELKCFCGFELREIAALHGVGERTLQGRWDEVRLLLRQTLD